MFLLEVILLALHIVLICNTTSNFDQVRFKNEQPQVLSRDLHVAIDTIHRTQDAANVLWVYRHNSPHAAWPTGNRVFIFMEARWKTLALSTRNLITWIKLNFVN